MSAILISTAIFCMLGVAAMAIYVALYGGHRVFQERFAEMAIKMQISEGEGMFAGGRESEGFAHTLFQWALRRMPKPKASPSSDKTIHTLVRAGFVRSGALRTFQLIRIIALAVTGIVGIVAATIFGLAAGRVALVVRVSDCCDRLFRTAVLSAPAREPAPKGYRAPALRRARFVGRLRRGGPWAVRSDQDRRRGDRSPGPGDRHRTGLGLC